MSEKIYNRPGLQSLAYRMDRHPTFLRRMLQRLPAQEIPDGPNAGRRPLAALTTPTTGDPAVALLDAWAVTVDVLTFYQERIANEGFLRTATERRSVLELARAIGYELSPGVAAATYLTFTVEDAPGSPPVVTVKAGTRVQSVPPPDQLPQTFETTEEIVARAEWNGPRAQTAVQQDLTLAGLTELYLQGTATRLQPGDPILIVGAEWAEAPVSRERWDFRFLESVEADTKAGQTRVTWQEGLGGGKGTPGQQSPRVYALRLRATLFGANAPEWKAMPTAFRTEYGGGTEWPNFDSFGSKTEIMLDAAYPKIQPGSWLVAAPKDGAELFRVEQAEVGAHAEFALSGKTTRVKLHKAIGNFTPPTTLKRRELQLFAESDELAVAALPLIRPVNGVLTVAEPVNGTSLTLDRLVTAPEKGRPLILTGSRVRLRIRAEGLTLLPDDGSAALPLPQGEQLRSLGAPVAAGGGRLTWHLQDQNGVTGSLTVDADEVHLIPTGEGDPIVSEVVTVFQTEAVGGRTRITFARPLTNWYDPATVALACNVARSTHGETVRELLGSSDARTSYQRFTLKKPPLTYLSAATSTGAESTLEVRVSDLRWQERASLYDLTPESQAYTVRIADDGKATVTFGDGVSGAKPPTGQQNIVATYRSGTGVAGNLPPGSLTMLLTRPQGMRGVTNPVPASGGADPEQLAEARENGPLKVLTLDRIVSLQDHADFARAFAGIAKARADTVWAGQQQSVCVTVAGVGGSPVPETGAVYTSLVAAMKRYGDPTRPFRVLGAHMRGFGLTASVFVQTPAYQPEQVLADLQTALAGAFAFDQRRLAQPVTAAEVLAVAHGVAGVTAVDLDELKLDQVEADEPIPRPDLLPARPARWQSGGMQAAELLVINPRTITLKQGVRV